MTNRVFVYGSMSTGMVHFDRIAGAVKSNINAIYNDGAFVFQLKVGYPVLIKKNGSNENQMGMDSAQKNYEIHGELLELNSIDLMLPLLDGFYGFSSLEPQKSLHFRELIQVKDSFNNLMDCWVYFLNPKKLPQSAVLISNGDWKALMAKPKFVDQLTSKQKTYIRKLSAVTGREVVPIDLSLYRELMKLELIVDKGRRLALSTFGYEVSRYLGESEN
jgi:gamma-glutamylcyclotransferase (GGCT)/AIG2-like uncharacterized protein YtfP